MKMPLEEVAAVLPVELAESLKAIPEEDKNVVEELRLRCGFPMAVLLPEGERDLVCPVVSGEHLREVLERATQRSAHMALEQVKNGFVTLKGGHRIGLCGSVVRKDGVSGSLRYLSSLSIRVAKAAEGWADVLVPELVNNAFMNTLILGPPGSGKTTLLRDAVRVLSDHYGYRVGIADERGEIAAMWQGKTQLYIGRRTDVLDGLPKAEGMLALLRGMNPDVLATDEITRDDDVEAMIQAGGCGVSLLATAHGGSPGDLEKRPVYRALIKEGVFQRLVLLERKGTARSYRVEALC